MAYRDAASFGKRQEYIAIAELLRHHFDIYMTLVDDQQIDCVIRQEKEGKLRYLDIQIKARSNECNPENAGRFAAMEIRNPRKDFYFIFYSEQADTYWVIPSLELIVEANQNKEGINKGKYSISFCNVTAKGVSPRPRFNKYENAFHILEWKDREPPRDKNEEGGDIEPVFPGGGPLLPKIPNAGRKMPLCWEKPRNLKVTLWKPWFSTGNLKL